MLAGLDGRVRALEGAIITQSITASQKIETAFGRLDEHTKQIHQLKEDLDCRVNDRIEVTDDLNKRMIGVEQVATTAKWILGIFAVMVAGLLWAIFTHQVELTFR